MVEEASRQQEAFHSRDPSPTVLEDAPRLQVHGTRGGVDVMRLSLSRVHCFVYYVIFEEEGRVEVISVWGQEIAHQPDFVDED